MEVVVAPGLRPEDEKRIKDSFQSFLGQAEEWAAKAMKIRVLDESDETGMENAKAAYKALRALQKEVEDTHKRLKEGALKYGQALDKIKRDFNDVIEPAKVHAKEQSEYAETMEKQRKAELKAKRMQILAPFNIDYAHYDLENMPEDLFELTVSGLKQKKAEQEAARAKEEEEKRAAMEAAKKEQERLQAEAAKAAKEREKAKAEAQVANRGAERQRRLLSLGWEWDGKVFFFGPHKITPDVMANAEDKEFEAALNAAKTGDADMDALKAYAARVMKIPEVITPRAKEIVRLIEPLAKAISDNITY